MQRNKEYVILSEAKDLEQNRKQRQEILRLLPQNDHAGGHTSACEFYCDLQNASSVVPYGSVAGHRIPDVRIQTALYAKRYPITGKTA